MVFYLIFQIMFYYVDNIFPTWFSYILWLFLSLLCFLIVREVFLFFLPVTLLISYFYGFLLEIFNYILLCRQYFAWPIFPYDWTIPIFVLLFDSSGGNPFFVYQRYRLSYTNIVEQWEVLDNCKFGLK